MYFNLFHFGESPAMDFPPFLYILICDAINLSKGSRAVETINDTMSKDITTTRTLERTYSYILVETSQSR